MTEFQTSGEYFAGSVYEFKSKGTLVDFHHASCWIPTQSGWVKAITKNFFTYFPGLSSDLVLKYLTKKNQPSLGTFNNLEKAYYPCRKRNSNQPQNQNQIILLHPRSHKAPILSSSRQCIWQLKITLIKKDGFRSHPSKTTNIYWWPIIMIQTPFIRNL